MKKFIIKSIVFVIPIIILIILVNALVDSAFVVNDRSDKIAEIITTGKNVAIKSIPSDWSSLQLSIVEKRFKIKDTAPKEIMVFGTSRSSEIASSFFKDQSFFNCAIPGGNILDYVALYSLYKQHHLLSKYIIISIDPWSFHSRKSVVINKEIQHLADSKISLTPSPSLLKFYNSGIESLNVNEAIITSSQKGIDTKILTELLSPNYFQINIRSAFSRQIVATSDSAALNNYFLIRFDGGYSLARQSQIDSVSVIEKSNRFISAHKGNFFLSSDTSSRYLDIFEKLLLKMKQEGVIPIIYISPVNPIVFKGVSNTSEAPVELALHNFCKKNQILKIGSFNPNKYGYNQVSNSFIDAYHPVKSVVNSIFQYHKHELDSTGIKLSVH
jgi:hypothetical protein